MNKVMDTSEFLKLQETEDGVILYINESPQEILAENGKMINNLTDKQMKFVSDHVHISQNHVKIL